MVGSVSDRYGQSWCHVKVVFGLGDAKEEKVDRRKLAYLPGGEEEDVYTHPRHS